MERDSLGFVGCLLLVLLCIAPALGRSDASLVFDLRVEMLRRLGAMPSFSACIVKGDTVAWQGAWGWADVYRSIPVSPETQYMIGSVSKIVTAAAILQLSEQGRFALDDNVSGFLPFELRNPNVPEEPITFRMLLSHRGSLSAENAHFFPTFYFRPYDPLELGSFLVPDGFNYEPSYWLPTEPGEQMAYANIGYELLAYLVEQVSGQAFADYVRDNIFLPLGMTDSTFSAAHASQAAMGYVAALGIPIPFGHYEIGAQGAGGIRSTIGDLARFAAALMNGGILDGARILDAETVASMQVVRGSGDPSADFEYGLGWMAFPGGALGGHAGGAFGSGTTLQIRMTDRTAVIYAYNRLNPALPPALAPLLNYAVGCLDSILWDLADRL